MRLVVDSNFIIDWLDLSFSYVNKNKKTLNSINVFPVPDCDTGNNMSMTLEGTLSRLRGEDSPFEDLDISKRVSVSCLISARGNSGIILSEVISSLCSQIIEDKMISANTLHNAFLFASQRARASISHPMEGTMLTVSDAAWKSLSNKLNNDIDLESLRFDLYSSLLETQNQIPALSATQVVDSGAWGLVLIYDALIDTIAGIKTGGFKWEYPTSLKKSLLTDKEIASQPYQYEIMFNCMADDNLIAMKKEISHLSTDLIVSGGPDICAVHMHVYDLSTAIEMIYEFIKPYNLKIHVISFYNNMQV